MAIVRTRQAPGCTHGPGCPHDIGPAAAGVGAAVNAMAAVEARVAEVPGSWMQHIVRGSGEVTTRKATRAELARLEPPETVVPVAPVREGPAIHVMRPAAAIAARSRQRGGERARAVYAERAASRRAQQPTASAPVPVPVTPATVEEDPVTTPPAPPAIPCGDCLHARVCRDRENVEGTDPRGVIEVRPGLRMVVLRIHECDDYLAPTFEPRAVAAPVVAPVPEPEPVRREHGGESWRTKAAPAAPEPARTVPVASADELTRRSTAANRSRQAANDRRAAEVLAVVERHGGDLSAAAKELGMRGSGVAMIVRNARLRAAAAS